MAKKKILFVDDEEVILRSFCVALNHKGFITSAASSGEEAIELFRSHLYDAVITDLKMPELDGIQVLKEAKKLHPQMVVIVLTGYGDLDSAIDSLRLGADDYLQKPCDIEELLCRLEKCLKQKEIENKLYIEKQKNDHYELITTLAGGISHDFNNILTGIMGCLEMLRDETSKKSALYFLDTAMTSCNQAKYLTSKFNQISDMYQSRTESVPVEELFDTLLKRFSADEGTKVKTHIAKDSWPVLIDFEKVIVALKAILDNAREFTEGTGEIQLTAENLPGKLPDVLYPGRMSNTKYVRIIIRDNGVGISSSNIPKIFNPYFSTKEKCAIKGMGMGLTLAAGLVRRCNGQIQVESEINKGTAVSVFLETPE